MYTQCTREHRHQHGDAVNVVVCRVLVDVVVLATATMKLLSLPWQLPAKLCADGLTFFALRRYDLIGFTSAHLCTGIFFPSSGFGAS